MGASFLSGGMLRIGTLFMILSIVLVILLKKVRKVVAKKKKAAILYLLFVLATFALTGLLSSHKVFNDTAINSFVGIQILFLILGIIHVYVIRKYFSVLSADEKDYFSELLFTLVFTFIGLIAFLFVVNHFRPEMTFSFLGGSLLFITPLFYTKMYEAMLKIPVPVYKKWQYPMNKDVKDPTKRELENPLVISFEFPKKYNQVEVTKFRVKAPEDMEFGNLFYFFLDDYNERHTEDKVEFMDQDTLVPDQWIFYYKPNWWSGLIHINHSKTVIGNGIKEDDVIICERIKEENQSEK